MKNFIKKLAKKAEGFTLVELVVVIAILGILAGVAVPAYSGYLEKAREAGDETTLGAIKTAAQAYKAQTGAVSAIVVDATSGDISKITVDGTIVYDEKTGDKVHNDDFMLYLTGTSTIETLDASYKLESKKFVTGADWSTAGWVAG